MDGLKILFGVKDGGIISAHETALVDAALSIAKSADIPSDQVTNTMDYINSQLLYNGNSISSEQRTSLESLLRDLSIRDE